MQRNQQGGVIKRLYKWGGKLTGTGRGIQARRSALTFARIHGISDAGAVAKIDNYVHKTSIHEGMVKMQSGPRRSQAVTFRMISENSDPKSWLHPGVPARPVHKAVSEMNSDAAKRMARQILES